MTKQIAAAIAIPVWGWFGCFWELSEDRLRDGPLAGEQS